MAPTRRPNTKQVMPNSSAETPSHFFKIILPSILEDKKLSLPEKFVKKFGSGLPAVVTLRIPTGSTWQVRLRRKGPMIWFQDGWQDFVKHNSINFGYLVVFKYVKSSSSIFNVLICDKSACEINYPSHGGEQCDYKKQNGAKRGRRKRPAAAESPMLKQGLEPQFKKCKMDSHELLASLGKSGITFSERCARVTQEERERVVKVARLFKAQNPCFMVILRTNYMNKGRVYVPVEFANEYWSKNTKFIKIRASYGREFLVDIAWRPAGGFDLTGGWPEISKEENLRKGDICVYELIRENDILLKLSVFRANLE